MGKFVLCIFLCALGMTAISGTKQLPLPEVAEMSEKAAYGPGADSSAGSRVNADMPSSYNAFVLGIAFTGAVGLLAFFTGLLFLYNREAIYLYYFLFLICCIAGAAINLSAYPWWDGTLQPGPGLGSRILELVNLLALFCYCLFSLRLLGVSQQAPALARWIRILSRISAVYGILYCLLYPWISGQQDILFIISRSVILPMSLMAIIWAGLSLRSVFKHYFMIGSLFYFLGALLGVLRQSGPGIPLALFYNISASAYFHTGIFLEIICFTMALTHRVFLLYRLRQKQAEAIRRQALQERDQALAELLSSRLKSNPHFIFNSLNAIQYLIESKQNMKAVKFLSTYSRFIRSLLDTGRASRISLKQELEIIRQYLIMESNRYGRTFTCQINVHPGLDLELILLPPLLLLPFIEQAIWDKLSGDESQPDALCITVEQTTSGYQIFMDYDLHGVPGSHSGKFHSSHGRKISNERIELYNRYQKNRIECFNKTKLDEKGNITGTRIIMTLTCR